MGVRLPLKNKSAQMPSIEVDCDTYPSWHSFLMLLVWAAARGTLRFGAWEFPAHCPKNMFQPYRDA